MIAAFIAAFIAAGTIWAAIELAGAADCGAGVAVGVNCVLTCAVCDRLAMAMVADGMVVAGSWAEVKPALPSNVVARRGTGLAGLVSVESIDVRCGVGVARDVVLGEVVLGGEVLGAARAVCLGVGMVDFDGVLTVDEEPFDEDEPVEEPEPAVSATAIPALWVIATPRPSATAAAPTRPTCLARPDVVSASVMGASSRLRLFNFPQKD